MSENSTPTQSRFRLSRGVILLGAIIVIFTGTYVFAWWNAYRLSQTYLDDANASYEDERYLDALRGYEEYDRGEDRYIQYGGYIDVEEIWKHKYARPAPSDIDYARERINHIIEERLTTTDAEVFVQENIGRVNPYMGLIYLRLGELYEADGNYRDAEDIYESIPDLFARDQDLIERARADLERLQAAQSSD